MHLLLGKCALTVLVISHQSLLTGLSIVSHNVCLIASILSLKLFPELGIFGPTAGVIGGALLQALILSPGLRGGGHRVGLLFDLANQRLREVVRLLIPNG